MNSSKLRRSLVCWLVLSPIVVTALFPFAVMLITALKPNTEVLTPTWWPSRVAWENFQTMWTATNFGNALRNSLYVSVLATLGLDARAPRSLVGALVRQSELHSGQRGRVLVGVQLGHVLMSHLTELPAMADLLNSGWFNDMSWQHTRKSLKHARCPDSRGTTSATLM